VGRLQPVKDQALLIEAYTDALRADPQALEASSLVIVGDGPCRESLSARVQALGMSDRIVLTGPRNDVAEVLRGFDLFVLPSLAEGISNTILEAMATGLPVLATRVGGNADLVLDGQTGTIVPAADRSAMTAALLAYGRDAALRRAHGRAGRLRAEREFSLDAMMRAYTDLYARQVARR
jgi:glycosyltransferase involved in cell wall biosynthesis